MKGCLTSFMPTSQTSVSQTVKVLRSALVDDGSAFLAFADLGLQVILLADLVHQADLGLEEVDMLLRRVLEDVGSLISRLTKSFSDLALGHGRRQVSARRALELEVGVRALAHRLSDAEPSEVLEVGQAIQQQDPLDRPVGVLHLADRIPPQIFLPSRSKPQWFIIRAWRKHWLMAVSSFFQELVKFDDDLWIALHDEPPGKRMFALRCALSLRAAQPRSRATE